MKDTFIPNVHLSRIALTIRGLRLQKGLDYKSLSELCNISVSKLVSFEYDKETPSDLELICILQALN